MDGGPIPGYGLSVKHLICAALIVLVGSADGFAQTDGFESALEQAREAAINHRYQEVIEILTPFNALEDPESRYITAAEIGRAYFHLGHYREAHQAFRQAVRLRPERVETAIYLEATSYLVGDKEQAYTVLREILKSGARDLYLAVTLPGERRFLADPKVHEITNEYAVPFEVDLEGGRVLGIGLGDSRDIAVETLDARSSDPSSTALTASAGPALIWAFVFDADQKLEEIVVQADHLYRYTPYRLRFDQELDWRLTPAAAIAAWGPPSRTDTSGDDGMLASWQFDSHRVDVFFGRPRQPTPPGVPEGAAVIRSLQLTRKSAETADRMIE
jgi:tetratricopeptide (TPR) repeat protein